MNIRALRDLPRGLVWLAAALLLAGMFLLLLGSVREDSLTADEPAHITAGYAYLRFRDGRFNPEHPPLLKMLAAAPLLPLPLHFPRDHPAWQDGPNGVRHLLPVFPFTILLVAREIIRWLGTVQDAGRHAQLLQVGTRGAVAVLLLWQCGSILHVYPAFLAYFNEAVGGPAGGVRYVGDSNLDWGQDLRRLRAFVDTQQIDRIAVAYFGGSSPPYELGRRYLPWNSALGPYKGWLAVSLTSWQIARALRASHPEDAYEWLQGKVPVARIGYSILVYDLRDLHLPCPQALGCETVRPERTQAGAEADDPSSTVDRPPPHAAIGDHPAHGK